MDMTKPEPTAASIVCGIGLFCPFRGLLGPSLGSQIRLRLEAFAQIGHGAADFVLGTFQRIAIGKGGIGAHGPVSYTHLPSPRDLSTSRMPSSA